MSPQALVNAIGLGIRQELLQRDPPARMPLQAQASRAALAMTHASTLVDGITDPQLRQAAAMAYCSLQYLHAALAQQARKQSETKAA